MYNNDISSSDNFANSPEYKPTTSTHRNIISQNLQYQQQLYYQAYQQLRASINTLSQQEQQQSFLEEGEVESNEEGLGNELLNKIKKMKMGRSSKQCTICQNNFDKGEIIRKLPCDHIFHEKCIIPWFNHNSKCPNCRLDLNEYFQEIDY